MRGLQEKEHHLFVQMRIRGAVNMGQVALTLNVMLKSPDTDISAVKNEIEKIAKPQVINEKPIAFGLKMLEVMLVFDDKVGANTDAIEAKLREIQGVSSVETGEVTLI
jgi:translation elongation factor aEF-1 beta